MNVKFVKPTRTQEETDRKALKQTFKQMHQNGDKGLTAIQKLTPQQKDQLLYHMAVMLGLIDENQA